MKVKEIVKRLVDAENYAQERLLVRDGVIKIIEDHMPVYWDLIKDKEKAFQDLSCLWKSLKK